MRIREYFDLQIQRAQESVLIFWLINPLTALISARGNADVLVCTAAIFTLFLVLRGNVSLFNKTSSLRFLIQAVFLVF